MICYFHCTLFCLGVWFIVMMVLVLHQLVRCWRGSGRDGLQPRRGGVVGGTGCYLVLEKYWVWHGLIHHHRGVLRKVRVKTLAWGNWYCGTCQNISVYIYTTIRNLLMTDETKWLLSYKYNIYLIALLSMSREVSFRTLLLLRTRFWSSCAINTIKLIARITYNFNVC